MSVESNLITLSFPTAAATDLSALQYTAVKVDTNGEVVAASSAKNIDGVLQNNPHGDTATVCVFGITKAIVGSGGVTAGALLQVGSGGTFVTASGGTVVGKALQTGAATNTISMLILKSNAAYS